MQRRGRRWSAADAYLRPARRRRNLDVLTDAHVTRVIVKRRRADGVTFHHRGAPRTVRAREVVLAAGAIASPQILMLSGIGPAAHLRAHGLDVVVDLPGVGQNLEDHVLVPVLFRTGEPVSLLAAQSVRELMRFLLRRRGLLTSNVAEAAAFLRSQPGLDAPDIELLFAPVLWVDEGRGQPAEHGFGIVPNVLRPRSRGSVTLASGDPLAPPVIRPNFLSDPDDMTLLVNGVKVAREIASARPFDDFHPQNIEPGDTATSDAEIEAWIRTRAQTNYHPVGTCRMGIDELAVVDPELRVRGVEGLRVADASVMPTIIRGHTTAPAMAIGERAADLMAGKVRLAAASTEAVAA